MRMLPLSIVDLGRRGVRMCRANVYSAAGRVPEARVSAPAVRRSRRALIPRSLHSLASLILSTNSGPMPLAFASCSGVIFLNSDIS